MSPTGVLHVTAIFLWGDVSLSLLRRSYVLPCPGLVLIQRSGISGVLSALIVLGGESGRGHRRRTNTKRMGAKGDEITRRRIDYKWGREQQSKIMPVPQASASLAQLVRA